MGPKAANHQTSVLQTTSSYCRFKVKSSKPNRSEAEPPIIRRRSRRIADFASLSAPMFHSRTSNRYRSILIPRYVDHFDSKPFSVLRGNKPNGKHCIPKPPKPTPKPREQIPFITDLKEIRDPDQALSLFHKYRLSGFKLNYPSYAALLYKLARARDFDAVDNVLSYVKDYNIRCKETIFIALMQHYGKSHLVDKAIELFHSMTCFNCARTLQSFNAIVNVLVDSGRFSDAKSMFQSSYKMGFRLNSVSFNVMIKVWLQKGEWEEAYKVFDDMPERNVEPSVVTYNSLIGFLCRRGDVGKAKDLLEDIIKKGKRPNALTYALLMEGLCSLGEYKEAKKMMFDMEYRGCKPTIVNFGVLLTDLGKRGKIEEAKSLLGEMKKRRFRPDVVTYNILINYMCKDGRVGEAYKVLIEMQVGGSEPNAATYRMMLDGFCQAEDFEGGLKVLNAMLIGRHCPRSETFCGLIVGLLKGGKIDEACFVLEEMVKRNMKFDVEAWEALIRDACSGDGGEGVLVNELISVIQ